MTEEKYQNKMKIILEFIHKEGYDKGIKLFVKKFPEHKIELLNPQFNQSVDNFIYCYIRRCKDK